VRPRVVREHKTRPILAGRGERVKSSPMRLRWGSGGGSLKWRSAAGRQGIEIDCQLFRLGGDRLQ
jgi:hypothetical protein